jgi:hypothetical protein
MTFDESPTTVILEKSATNLGYAMNEIRSWLDGHRIQPVGFKTSRGRQMALPWESGSTSRVRHRCFCRNFTLNGRRHSA